MNTRIVSESESTTTVTSTDQVVQRDGWPTITLEQRQMDMQIRLEQAAARRETDATLQAAGRVWQTDTAFQRQRQRPISVLSINVPPMFEDAVGYPGEAHYVAMHQSHDAECVLDDGREVLTGESDAWTLFLHHWSVEPIIQRYFLGLSADRVAYQLVLDRWQRQFAVALTCEVQHLLRHQWQQAATEEVIVLNQAAEWTHLVQDIKSEISQITVNPFALEMHHQTLVLELTTWLNQHG